MFKEQIPTNQSENDGSNPEENSSEKSGLLGKLKDKTKGIAKVLTLATALNAAPVLAEKTKTLDIAEANAAEIPHRPIEINSDSIKNVSSLSIVDNCDFSPKKRKSAKRMTKITGFIDTACKTTYAYLLLNKTKFAYSQKT